MGLYNTKKPEKIKKLAKKKKQVEKIVKKTTGLVSGALSKIQKAQAARKKFLDSL